MLIECFVADKDMDPPQIWLKLIPLTFEFMAPTLERDHQSSLCIEFVAKASHHKRSFARMIVSFFTPHEPPRLYPLM